MKRGWLKNRQNHKQASYQVLKNLDMMPFIVEGFIGFSSHTLRESKSNSYWHWLTVGICYWRGQSYPQPQNSVLSWLGQSYLKLQISALAGWSQLTSLLFDFHWVSDWVFVQPLPYLWFSLASSSPKTYNETSKKFRVFLCKRLSIL